MVLRYTDKSITQFYRAIAFFFQFIGLLTHETLVHWGDITWRQTLKDVLRASAAMIIPLVTISFLLSASLTLSIHYLLAGFKLHNRAMELMQGMMIRDFVPLPISFMLCVHCGLNLIEYHHIDLHRSPQKVILSGIIPLLFSLNLSAVLLYAYTFVAFFIGIIFTSYWFLDLQVNEYWLKLSESIDCTNLISSLLKTIMFVSIAGIIAGYYYFNVASKKMHTRKAVSRIITRGLFWLITTSVLLKF